MAFAAEALKSQQANFERTFSVLSDAAASSSWLDSRMTWKYS